MKKRKRRRKRRRTRSERAWQSVTCLDGLSEDFVRCDEVHHQFVQGALSLYHSRHLFNKRDHLMPTQQYTVGQINQEPKCNAHSFAYSALLASLTRSAAPSRSLARSLPHSWNSGWSAIFSVFFLFWTIVQYKRCNTSIKRNKLQGIQKTNLIDSTLSGYDDEDGKLVGFEVSDGGGGDTAEMSRHHRQQFGPVMRGKGWKNHADDPGTAGAVGWWYRRKIRETSDQERTHLLDSNVRSQPHVR